MEQHAAQVMAPGGLLIDLPVEHVRQPGERMPVGGVEMAEGPDHVFPAQAASDVRVAIDILAVVRLTKPCRTVRPKTARTATKRKQLTNRTALGVFTAFPFSSKLRPSGATFKEAAPQAVRASAGKPWGLPLPAAVRG